MRKIYSFFTNNLFLMPIPQAVLQKSPKPSTDKTAALLYLEGKRPNSYDNNDDLDNVSELYRFVLAEFTLQQFSYFIPFIFISITIKIKSKFGLLNNKCLNFLI